jgi:hypothetical protein
MSSQPPHPVDDAAASLLAADLSWPPFTKEDLSSEDVLIGLLDHGLFSEKVPPCFITVGLAAIATDLFAGLLEEVDDKKLRKKLGNTAHDYIRSEALRDINIPRHMGIPHPESYSVQAMAISKYWMEIAEHCNKPNPAVSRVHVRHVGGGKIFEMNYKGDERFQLEEDETQWMAGAQYLVEADIAACFPSIYTHCIPWALHGKAESKMSGDLTKLIGNLLDKCTQNTRDRQTNGLLIGPHASNIVSEIILTRIDTELQAKGYGKCVRHVDDYKFYASTADEAESFIRDLGLSLRTLELSLNEKKTQILSLPRPSDANWRLLLNRFHFPVGQDISFATIRSYLDLALECAQSIGKSTPLNYAIKTIFGHKEPRRLNERAKRMYAQEAMNLALSFPYLAPLLDEFVFARYWYDGLLGRIAVFLTALVNLGIRKLYPDTICQALYLALKYQVVLALSEEELLKLVEIDDCVANVLLLEYANRHSLAVVRAAVMNRAESLKSDDPRERDRHWLLIYQVWSEAELQSSGQSFLAKLKSKSFLFFEMPHLAKKLKSIAADTNQSVTENSALSGGATTL